MYDKIQQEAQSEYDANRKSAVGTGDRSERIRTYNFPQNRVTDHRIGLTIQKLDQILAGKLDEIVDALIMYYQTSKLEAMQNGEDHISRSPLTGFFFFRIQNDRRIQYPISVF